MLTVPIVLVTISVLGAWIWAAIRGRRARARRFPQYNLQSTPCVSILVPAWNERTILERCVASLRRLEYPEWECIIVAGGTDGTFEHAQSLVAAMPNCMVIAQRPGGKNAALNDGLALARGSILVLLDADCEVEPAWLGALVSPVITFADASLGNYGPDLATPVSLQFEMNKVTTYFVRGVATLHWMAFAYPFGDFGRAERTEWSISKG
jgi:glycosyltransferase involved in cell wall biosynthesis